MARVKIHNVSHERDAKPLRDLLQGKSCMKLEVLACPVGGSFDIHVETLDPNVSEAEVTLMVLGVLSHQVCRASRAVEFNRDPAGKIF
jgi:hypothetical protein